MTGAGGRDCRGEEAKGAFVCWRVRVPAESSRVRIDWGVLNKMAVYKRVGRETFKRIVHTLAARSRTEGKVTGNEEDSPMERAVRQEP